MKKILVTFIFLFTLTTSLSADQKCKDLPGFKKLGKSSIDYVKCLANKGKKELKGNEKLKLNTDSKLTDWIKKKLNK